MSKCFYFSMGAALAAGLASAGLAQASMLSPTVEIAVNGGSFIPITNQSGTSGQFANSGGYTLSTSGLSWSSINALATNSTSSDKANLQLTIDNLAENSTGTVTYEIQVTDTGFTFTGSTVYLETSGVLDTTTTTQSDLVAMKSGAASGTSPYTYADSLSPTNSPISTNASTNTQSYTFRSSQTPVSVVTPYSLSTEFSGNMGAGDIFGTLGGSTIISTTPIPEPATLSLLAVGGLGILIRRRKSA